MTLRKAKLAKKSARKGSAKRAAKKGAPRSMYETISGRRAETPVAGRIERIPAGFRASTTSGIIVPSAAIPEPVAPSKMKKGIAQAKRALDDTLRDILETLTGDYRIREIKLIASFDAKGEFLGFGIGGAASMEITICPCEDDA